MAYSTPEENRPPRHDIPLGGRSGFVMVNDLQIHYLEWGRSTAPPVVCMHGGGQTAYMFEDLGAALAERYHVIAYDFPDHGDSDPYDAPGAGLDRNFLADTTEAVCAEFGLGPVMLVGGSMGGITGATFAATRPDLTAGLVMLDVGHRLESEGVERIVQFMSDPDSFATLEEAAKAIEAYSPGRKVVTGRLTRNLRQRADGRWVWKHGLGRRIREFGTPAQIDQGKARAVVAGLEDDLRSLACPVLVLRGARSDVLSEGGADELVNIIPNARFASISGAGHLAAGDNPTSFVALVKSFLDELTEPEGDK